LLEKQHHLLFSLRKDFMISVTWLFILKASKSVSGGAVYVKEGVVMKETAGPHAVPVYSRKKNKIMKELAFIYALHMCVYI
ncbi:unnamed protein product, partial [Bubo scandiacus]